MKKILQKVKSYIRGNSLNPVRFIQIELTNHCNYKCPFCPQSQYKKAEFQDVPFNRDKGFMDFDLFKNIVAEATEVAEEINFSFFGEPMMHPEFLKFMGYLKNRDPSLRVVMNTNLSYATEEIFKKLIEIDLTEFRMSVDAATAETYDIVRPGKYFVHLDGTRGKDNRFETITKKMEYWFSLSDHRPTRHVYTVNSNNVKEVDKYVKRWEPLLGENDHILTKNVLTYGGKISDPYIKPGPCNIWKDNNLLTVDWNGEVSPCNLDTNMDLVIGNIKQTPLLELHLGEKRKEIERLSRAREIVPCKTCVDANSYTIKKKFSKGDKWDDKYQKIYELSE